MIINLTTHALMLMPGAAIDCMSRLNQIDIYPSCAVDTPSGNVTVLVVPQYAVGFIRNQLSTCLCNFAPPTFINTVDAVRSVGMCYTQISPVYAEVFSPDTAIVNHLVQRVVPFMFKKSNRLLVRHAFHSLKNYVKKCKILREQQSRIAEARNATAAAERVVAYERCTKALASHLLRKHRRREDVGRAFAKWVVVTSRTSPPPPSPRTKRKSPNWRGTLRAYPTCPAFARFFGSIGHWH